jgi:hypothetical protein
MVFEVPSSLHLFASAMVVAMPWEASGAGIKPSELAKVIPASNTST